LAPAHYAFPLDLQAIAKRLGSVTLAGRAVPMLAPEDLFYLLAVHGSKHKWACLLWVCDIQQLLTKYRNIDWSALLARAKELGTLRPSLFALHTAHVLLNVPIPPAAKEAISKDPVIAELAAEVVQNLSQETACSKVQYHLSVMRLRERKRDRLRYIHGILLNPTSSEWSAVRLPACLSFLYPAVRLLRCVKLLRGKQLSTGPELPDS
jgi:hypothetical protein